MTERKVISNFFDEVPLTKTHLKLIVIIAIAMVFEQADNYNFSFIAPVLREYWGLSIQQIGFINSLFALGMLIGTFIFGLCSDLLGRKKTLLITAFIFSAGSLLNGLAPNVEIFTVMRFLTGLGISGVLIVAPSYMMEMLPSKGRGRIFGIATTVGFLGIPAIAFLCNIILPLGGEHWRLVYALGAAGLLIVLFGAAWLKESPRWLVLHGRIKEAEAIVEEIAGPGYQADLSHTVVTNEKIPVSEIFRELFSRRSLKNTIILIIAYSLVISAGLLFVNFASTILVDRGFSMEEGLKLTSLLSIGMFLGPVVASVIADWGGRKIPIASCAVILIGCIIVYAYADSFTAMCVAAVAFSALSQTALIILNAYAPEMYPTKIRNAAVGVVTAIGRIFNIVMMSVFPALYAGLGFSKAYMILAAFYVIVAIAIGFFGKCTSGVSLEELNQ